MILTIVDEVPSEFNDGRNVYLAVEASRFSSYMLSMLPKEAFPVFGNGYTLEVGRSYSFDNRRCFVKTSEEDTDYCMATVSDDQPKWVHNGRNGMRWLDSYETNKDYQAELCDRYQIR